MKKEIILTTMCALIDGDNVLVELREKSDWPGLTFPGGHVEDNETSLQACVREMKEETGLDIFDVENVGYIEWNEPSDNKRHLSLLYIAKGYKGKIQSSKEGKVFFIKKEEINNYPFSNDFDKILKIIFKN